MKRLYNIVFLIFFALGPFHTPAFCDEMKDLAMTYQMASKNEISTVTKGKSREEKNFIKKCPIITVEIKNAKPDEEFFLFRKNLLGTLKKIGNEPKKGNAKIQVILDGYYMPGEPIDIIAISTDDRRFAEIHLIPSPIEAKSDKGRRLSIESRTSDRLFYIAHIDGFEPNEPITVVIKSGHATDSLESKVSADKKLDLSITPALSGVPFGNASVEIHAKNPDEVLKVEFEWGISKELLAKMRDRK